jgi:hypothetical protein
MNLIEKLSHPIPCFEDVCDNAQTMHDAAKRIAELEGVLKRLKDTAQIGHYDGWIVDIVNSALAGGRDG